MSSNLLSEKKNLLSGGRGGCASSSPRCPFTGHFAVCSLLLPWFPLSKLFLQSLPAGPILSYCVIHLINIPLKNVSSSKYKTENKILVGTFFFKQENVKFQVLEPQGILKTVWPKLPILHLRKLRPRREGANCPRAQNKLVVLKLHTHSFLISQVRTIERLGGRNGVTHLV